MCRHRLQKGPAMRFLPALALATGIAAGLMSAPASAAETCPIGRAVYEAKEAPAYRMTFGHGYDVSAISGAAATVTGEGGERLADLSITWSMGYSVAFYSVTSGHVPGTVGGGRIVGLSRDFAYEGPPGYPTGDAPYALILPDLGGWLYNSTKHEEGKTVPEGAWILVECR